MLVFESKNTTFWLHFHIFIQTVFLGDKCSYGNHNYSPQTHTQANSSYTSSIHTQTNKTLQQWSEELITTPNKGKMELCIPTFHLLPHSTNPSKHVMMTLDLSLTEVTVKKNSDLSFFELDTLHCLGKTMYNSAMYNKCQTQSAKVLCLPWYRAHQYNLIQFKWTLASSWGSRHLSLHLTKGLSWFILIQSELKLARNSQIICAALKRKSKCACSHGSEKIFVEWVWHSS